MRDNVLHGTIQVVKANPSHLTNLHLIDYSSYEDGSKE
jgi:hypothetical protein